MAHADTRALTTARGTPAPRIRSRRRPRRTLRRIRQQVSVALLALVFLFPLLVMVSTAFKTPTDIFSSPPTLLPSEWTTENFATAFEQIPVWRYLANTLFVSGMSILGTVISCPLVAYALAKVRWRGARPLLILVLATMMLPPQVTLIPLFLVWNGLEATNS